MDQLLYDRLTPKELECVRLVARNRTSKEIGRELGRSEHTIDNQIKSAMAKVRAPSRYALARLVAEHEGRSQGLASPPLVMVEEAPQLLAPPEPPLSEGSRLREEGTPFRGFPVSDVEPRAKEASATEILLRIGAAAAILLVLALGSVALLQAAQSLANMTAPMN